MNARFFRLDGTADSQLWISEASRMPRLLHWGAQLPAGEDLEALARALEAPIPQGGLDVAEFVSWLPEPGRGFADLPGLVLRRGDSHLLTAFELREAVSLADGWRFELADPPSGVALVLWWIQIHFPFWQ